MRPWNCEDHLRNGGLNLTCCHCNIQKHMPRRSHYQSNKHIIHMYRRSDLPFTLLTKEIISNLNYSSRNTVWVIQSDTVQTKRKLLHGDRTIYQTLRTTIFKCSWNEFKVLHCTLLSTKQLVFDLRVTAVIEMNETISCLTDHTTYILILYYPWAIPAVQTINNASSITLSSKEIHFDSWAITIVQTSNGFYLANYIFNRANMFNLCTVCVVEINTMTCFEVYNVKQANTFLFKGCLK